MRNILKKSLLTIMVNLPLTLIMSCSTGFNKENELKKLQSTKVLLDWGDDKFVNIIRKNNLNHTSYFDDAKRVGYIAPYNKDAKRSNVMYQLTVYSFADGNNDGIGDFIGLKNNLDYFVNLGIDTLYLSPIHPASSYHGYDVIDYTDVAPELGGMKAFDEFLIKAHEKGIRVVLDMVFNHTSYEHPWFQKALQNDPKYKNFYYIYDKSANQKEGKDNIKGIFKNIDKNIKPNNEIYWAAEFWSGMPDLNLNNPEVIEELKNVHRFWAKKGVDGFRYDAFYHYFDSNNPIKGKSNKGNEVELFKEFRKVINQEYKNAEGQKISRSSLDAFMFGEWWDDASEFYAQNTWYSKDKKEKALSSVIDGKRFKFNTNVNISYNSELDLIQRLTDKDGKIREWIPFLDNHDVERWINWIRSQHGDTVTEEPHKLTTEQRAWYEEALISLLSRGGLPTLYNGNELLMQGGPKTQDINVREAFWWNDTSKNVYFKEAKNPGDLITTKASPGEGSVESIVNNPNSSYNLLAKMIKLRKEYDSLKEMDKKYVADPGQVLEFIKPFRENINSEEVTLRNNQDGTYILIIHSSNPYKIGNLGLKPNYKVEKTFFTKNIEISSNEKGIIFKGNKTLKIGAFLIKEVK
ncbi:alpha-amylase family glycosyl hydrolase [Mycoplasmopsis cynos]|uniref:alpha-amylase family glycosyl hydrolase n=1 Tax=Mycoplasmopsis cynos TaxID=171284 RepID=UPI002AFE133F|nr:alpha-amylase family glycosyl hydrolase [Mycoplasmopsis cynos]WQQ18678.1 alpha-amylase family glycosyl hydrolase [Mycoplasmopsis cynos]